MASFTRAATQKISTSHPKWNQLNYQLDINDYESYQDIEDKETFYFWYA